MKFWFCETCGKRLTDAEINAGEARDKKLKGVFCTDCAIGVLTMESIPLSESQAKKLLNQQNQAEASRRTPHKDSSRRMPPAAINPRKLPKPHTPSVGQVQAGLQSLILIAGAVVVVAIAVGGIFVLGRKNAPSEHNNGSRIDVQAPAHTKSPVVDSPKVLKAAELPRSTSSSVTELDSHPEIPSSPAVSSTEQKALDEYEILIRFDGLADGDKTRRIVLLEEFIAKSGECMAAVRARALISSLKVSPAPLPASIPDPPPAKTREAAYRENFDDPAPRGLACGDAVDFPNVVGHGRVLKLKGSNIRVQGEIASYAYPASSPQKERRYLFLVPDSARLQFRYFNKNAQILKVTVAGPGEKEKWSKTIESPSQGAWKQFEMNLTGLTEAASNRILAKDEKIQVIYINAYGEGAVEFYVDDLEVAP